MLLTAVEGSAGRIVRVNPRDGSEVTELDLPNFLRQHWGMPASYMIAAYNDMANAHDPAGGEALLIGLEVFIPVQAQIAAGHNAISVETSGWYLVRRANGHYDLRQVDSGSRRALAATRSIRASLFPRERDAAYFSGFDANKVPAHDTVWIMRSTIAGAIGVTRPH